MRTKLFSRLIAILMLTTGIGILLGQYVDNMYKTKTLEAYLSKHESSWKNGHKRSSGVTIGICTFLAAGAGATMWPIMEVLSSGIYWIIRPRNKSLTTLAADL